jgi:diadenosine tetraphosphate (Ap4A) HIT family hydrolase
VHILVVPKVQLQDWLSIKSNDIEIDMMREFIDLTQSLIQEYGLTDTGYRLILNGGNYQTFPHLHVHLVSGDATTTQA